MKKLLFIALLLPFLSHAQQTITAKKVIVSDSIRLAGRSTGSISNDSSELSKMPSALITEWAAKNYVDNHKGGGLDTTLADARYQAKNTLTVAGTAATDPYPSGSWQRSLFIGRNYDDTTYDYKTGGTYGVWNSLIISPVSTFRYSNHAPSVSTLLMAMTPDYVNDYNVVVGSMSASTSRINGNHNVIVRATPTGNGITSCVFGTGNTIMGSNINYANNYNVLIGQSTATQAGAWTSTNTKNASSQINIGNYIYRDSLSHFGIGRWATTGGLSVAVDLLSTTTNGGMLIPSGTTAQRQALTAVDGLLFYDKTLHALCYYNGTNWQKFTSTNAD